MTNEMKVNLLKVRTMDSGEPLAELLRRVKEDSVAARLRKVGYQEIRLESIRAPGDEGNASPFWFLDFTKLRFEHGPGKISRREPIEGFELGEDQGFGEETAVLFDPTTSHILFQYNHNGPRAGAIEEYLCNYENGIVGKYSFHVVLDDTASVRLAQKDVIKKIHFKVASPRLTAEQRRGNVSLGRALDMADNLEGETIEIVVSAGRGRLSAGVEGIINTLRRFVPVGEDPLNSPLKTFKVYGKTGENGETDEINMLLSKEEITIADLEMGADLRYTQESRWQGLLRARRGWNGKI